MSIAIFLLFFIAIFGPLVAIAGRRKKMQQAGTWLGAGSIECEDRWNSRNAIKRSEMLNRTGIGTDHPEYRALISLTWAQLPAERRQLIFDAARAKTRR